MHRDARIEDVRPCPRAVVGAVSFGNKDDLFAFYDVPAACGLHPRAENPVESTFAAA